MGKFLSMAQTATRLIKKSGISVTLTRTTETSFDPVTQARTTTEESHSLWLVANPPSMAQKFGVDLAGKDAVELLIAAEGASTIARPGDVVMIRGVNWKIFAVQTIDPAADGAVMSVAYAERGSK